MIMKFKEELQKTYTDDFYYDLFYGGYIAPEKMLVSDEDIKKVQEAMAVIEQYKQSGIEQGKFIES